MVLIDNWTESYGRSWRNTESGMIVGIEEDKKFGDWKVYKKSSLDSDRKMHLDSGFSTMSGAREWAFNYMRDHK